MLQMQMQEMPVPMQMITPEELRAVQQAVRAAEEHAEHQRAQQRAQQEVIYLFIKGSTRFFVCTCT